MVNLGSSGYISTTHNLIHGKLWQKWYKILWAMLGTHEVAQIVMWLVMSGKSGFKWIHFYHSQLDTWQKWYKILWAMLGTHDHKLSCRYL